MSKVKLVLGKYSRVRGHVLRANLQPGLNILTLRAILSHRSASDVMCRCGYLSRKCFGYRKYVIGICARQLKYGDRNPTIVVEVANKIGNAGIRSKVWKHGGNLITQQIQIFHLQPVPR